MSCLTVPTIDKVDMPRLGPFVICNGAGGSRPGLRTLIPCDGSIVDAAAASQRRSQVGPLRNIASLVPCAKQPRQRVTKCVKALNPSGSGISLNAVQTFRHFESQTSNHGRDSAKLERHCILV